MNKAELIEKVREAVPTLSKSEADSAIDCALDIVMETLISGQRVSLFGFGAFIPSARAPRTGRNPRTGEAVRIPAGRAIRFTPSAAFKAALNPKPVKRAAKKATAKKASKAGAARAAPAKAGSRASAATKAAAKKTATSTRKR